MYTEKNMASTRNGIPIPRLEISSAAVRNPGVTVVLEPGASGGGREIREKVKLLLLQQYRCTGMVLL